jgi:hypothetical protein
MLANLINQIIFNKEVIYMKLLMNEKMKVYVKFGEFHEDSVLIIEDKDKKERYDN